jgi:hypothetical protein
MAVQFDPSACLTYEHDDPRICCNGNVVFKAYACFRAAFFPHVHDPYSSQIYVYFIGAKNPFLSVLATQPLFPQEVNVTDCLEEVYPVTFYQGLVKCSREVYATVEKIGKSIDGSPSVVALQVKVFDREATVRCDNDNEILHLMLNEEETVSNGIFQLSLLPAGKVFAHKKFFGYCFSRMGIQVCVHKSRYDSLREEKKVGFFQLRITVKIKGIRNIQKVASYVFEDLNDLIIMPFVNEKFDVQKFLLTHN